MPKFAVAASSRHIDSGSGDDMDVRPGSRRLSSPAGVFALLVSLLAGLLVAFGPAAPAAAGPAEDIYSLVNQARAAEGLPPLTRNPGLDAAAAGWAKQMANMGDLQHNPNVGDQIPSGWSSWGENIAQGHQSGAAMHEGWMNSPGHYRNIMGDFSDIGVAFLESGGTTWGVQVFATYSGGAGRPVAPPAADAQTAPAPAPTPEERAATEQAAADKAAADKAAAEEKAAAEKAAAEKAAAEKAAKQKAAAEKKSAQKEAAVAAGSVPTATAVAAPEPAATEEATEVPLSASITRALSPATNPAVLLGMGAALLLALILLSPTLRRILLPRRRHARHR
jgi:pyruvate/2-oxoglutarate dehydrogenase complex dihydrolipoamide acyltransferase (E2) component